MPFSFALSGRILCWTLAQGHALCYYLVAFQAISGHVEPVETEH